MPDAKHLSIWGNHGIDDFQSLRYFGLSGRRYACGFHTGSRHRADLAMSGPAFGFSDTWQLVVNTGTTTVTFLMVFLIQKTQYRDTQALQLQMDELIRTTSGAQNILLNLESMDAVQLDELRRRYEALAETARKSSEKKSKWA